MMRVTDQQCGSETALIKGDDVAANSSSSSSSSSQQKPILVPIEISYATSY